MVDPAEVIHALCLFIETKDRKPSVRLVQGLLKATDGHGYKTDIVAKAVREFYVEREHYGSFEATFAAAVNRSRARRELLEHIK